MHPRNYISYSQLKLWETNPSEYARRYFYGEKGSTNRGQALGTEIHKAIETGEETGEFEKDMVIAQFPAYEWRDKDIKCALSVGKGKSRHFIPILMRPDSCRADFSAFYEYKNGSTKWDQKKVDNDDQITFYTAGLYLKVKEAGRVEIPKSELIWAPTEKRVDEDGVERPHLIGIIQRFPTRRTFVDILKMHARISKVWVEIGEAMENEII